MATVSMSKAATLVGMSKATLSKALKSGKLSYVEKTTTGYLIDTSELFRVFNGERGERFTVTGSEPPEKPHENDAIIAILKNQLHEKDAIIADLREDRDIWRQQATSLLTDQRPKGFWARLKS